MAMNRVQFQPGLALPAFLQRYGSEAACEAELLWSRWPQGFVCPRCAATRAADLRTSRSPALAVHRLPSAEHASRQHGVRPYAAAADDVVSRAVPADPEQDQCGGVRADAPLGRVLSHRLAGETQADASDVHTESPAAAG